MFNENSELESGRRSHEEVVALRRPGGIVARHKSELGAGCPIREFVQALILLVPRYLPSNPSEDPPRDPKRVKQRNANEQRLLGRIRELTDLIHKLRQEMDVTTRDRISTARADNASLPSAFRRRKSR
jgi:hypothetical protein